MWCGRRTTGLGFVFVLATLTCGDRAREDLGDCGEPISVGADDEHVEAMEEFRPACSHLLALLVDRDPIAVADDHRAREGNEIAPILRRCGFAHAGELHRG